jgi:hypothetical protein
MYGELVKPAVYTCKAGECGWPESCLLCSWITALFPRRIAQYHPRETVGSLPDPGYDTT